MMLITAVLLLVNITFAFLFLSSNLSTPLPSFLLCPLFPPLSYPPRPLHCLFDRPLVFLYS